MFIYIPSFFGFPSHLGVEFPVLHSKSSLVICSNTVLVVYICQSPSRNSSHLLAWYPYICSLRLCLYSALQVRSHLLFTGWFWKLKFNFFFQFILLCLLNYCSLHNQVMYTNCFFFQRSKVMISGLLEEECSSVQIQSFFYNFINCVKFCHILSDSIFESWVFRNAIFLCFPGNSQIYFFCLVEKNIFFTIFLISYISMVILSFAKTKFHFSSWRHCAWGPLTSYYDLNCFVNSLTLELFVIRLLD